MPGLVWCLQELLMLPDNIFVRDPLPSRGKAEGGGKSEGGGRDGERSEGGGGAANAEEFKEKWRLLLDIVPDLPVSQISDEQCRRHSIKHSGSHRGPC